MGNVSCDWSAESGQKPLPVGAVNVDATFPSATARTTKRAVVKSHGTLAVARRAHGRPAGRLHSGKLSTSTPTANSFVRDGDIVVVHSLERLARNLDDLRRRVQQLTAKGVRCNPSRND